MHSLDVDEFIRIRSVILEILVQISVRLQSRPCPAAVIHRRVKINGRDRNADIVHKNLFSAGRNGYRFIRTSFLPLFLILYHYVHKYSTKMNTIVKKEQKIRSIVTERKIIIYEISENMTKTNTHKKVILEKCKRYIMNKI